MMYRRYCIAFSAFTLLIAIIAFGTWALWPSQNTHTTSLSGFAPNTHVTYKILSPTGVKFSETNRTDKDGDVHFSYAEDLSGHERLIHAIKIETRDDLLEVLLHDIPGENRVITSSSGIDEFAEFTIRAPGHMLQSRADWAGHFHSDITLERTQKHDEVIEIALLGMEGLKALQEDAPRPGIIRVQLSETPMTDEERIKEIKKTYIASLMLMTEQLSAVAMQQIFAIGTFFDAKMQLETQRTHQQLKAEAVKDYHPSDQMCRIGTYVRSLAKSETKSRADHYALNEILMSRAMSAAGTSTVKGYSSYAPARLEQFRRAYCDPKDNNEGLLTLCLNTAGIDPTDSGASDKTRFNKDIDFMRTAAFPKTIDVDFQDGENAPDEEDIIALAQNLYWPEPLEFGEPKPLAENELGFLKAQRYIALNSLAHNSFASYISSKSRAASPSDSDEPGWMFMKALMREFGIPDTEIEQLLGEQPSYYAQMDVLAKKIYQSPNFYTNLYDKPTNVERISVALDAIKLMQMRDQYDSTLRREMLTSGMLETELTSFHNDANTRLMRP